MCTKHNFESRFHMYASLYLSNKLVSSSKSSPKKLKSNYLLNSIVGNIKNRYITTHAEIKTLINYINGNYEKLKKIKRKSNFEIIVERYHMSGRPMLARPCLLCIQVLKNLGIKKISYTTSNGIISENINTTTKKAIYTSALRNLR